MRIGCRRQWVPMVLLSLVFITTGKAGVIAYWGFDDSGLSMAREERGGKDGIHVGNPQRVEGRIGQALKFSGGGDYIRVRHDTVFDVRGDITIAAWIKPGRFKSVYATIIAKGDGAWRVARDENRDTLEFAANSGDDMWVVRGSKSVNDGKWHHVAGVFDGATACLYVDGELDASLSTTRQFNTNGLDVCIGENIECPGRYWKGLIDDVLILDHALNAAQVKELCAKGAKVLVSDELGILSGAISEAQRVLAERGGKDAIAFLRQKLAESERVQAKSPSQIGPAGRMILSELYFLLAEAQAAAGARQADIIQSYRKTVTTSLGSRRFVPALLRLFEHVSAGEYARIVGESVRGSQDPGREIHLIAAQLEENANWSPFEQFLDAAFPHVTDQVAFAKRIGRGLAGQTAWAEPFAQYCRNRPLLKPYYISTRIRLAQETVARYDFMGAAEIYRSILAEGGREEDAIACEIGICECLFHDGQYRLVISQIDRLATERGAIGLPEIGPAQLLKGRAYMQLDELGQATEIFSRLAAVDPSADGAPEAVFLLGYCRLRQKDWDEASRTFTVVVEKYPESSFAGKARLGLRRVQRMRQ